MNGLEASFQLSINGRSGPRRPLPAGLSGHARKQGADLISAAAILQLGGRHGGQRLGYLLHPPNFNFVLRQLPAAPFSTMNRRIRSWASSGSPGYGPNGAAGS